MHYKITHELTKFKNLQISYIIRKIKLVLF